MSNFNYMDNVPVKIAEKYKPLPLIYQVPQSVTNKLNLPDGHFHSCSQFTYDFQLEHKVLTKIPEYKRKRQFERTAREERKEKREQEQQRRLEEEHKQMLGAVSYPNAAELSSSESDNDDYDSEKTKQGEENSKALNISKDNWLAGHCFNNILQPTVLLQNGSDASENTPNNAFNLSLKHNHAKLTNKSTNSSSSNNYKLANSFNYKDFEDDTSSPFDNIELKTINDLDILRQVLHNTQIKANRENAEAQENSVIQENEHITGDNDNNAVATTMQNTKEYTETLPAITSNTTSHIVYDMSTVENTKAALEKVNFSDINIGLEPIEPQHQQIDHIPTHNYKNTGSYYGVQAYGAPAMSLPQYYCNGYANSIQDQPTNCEIYHNQNYLYSPNCNSDITAATIMTDYSNVNSTSPSSFAHPMNYVCNNVNKLLPTTDNVRNVASFHNTEMLHAQQTPDGDHQCSKSKSVPDLFQELREEVRNSQMRRRRSRNYSHNIDGNNELKDVEENDQNSKEFQEPTDNMKKQEDSLETFNNLESSVQKLARNISSMGFPLGRVATIAQIYGEDDKKIVEHLIPLTELLDLGFDEKQISEALIKCDNNKEKALEHLIS